MIHPSATYKYIDCTNNLITSISNIASYVELGNTELTAFDIRGNLLDCGDWNDVLILIDHLGEPVFTGLIDEYFQNGFAFSPQLNLNPYECGTSVANWWLH